MKRTLIVLVSLTLFSCAGAGPVYVARDQSDAVRTTYGDPKLNELNTRNQTLLKEIYGRFSSAGVDVYPEGIGMTELTDREHQRLYYLMVRIRPSGVVFDQKSTTPQQRFSQVLQLHVEKYLRYVKKEDLDRDGIQGLDLGVYWPVRDYTVCNQYGGFVEYVNLYFRKADAQAILTGARTFPDVVTNNAEVITSLNLAPAQSVKPVF
jgi:hypothetical protein